MVGGCHFQAFWVGSKPVRSNFLHIFGVRKKIKKKNFQEKSVFIGKNRSFSEKNRFLSEKIGFYRKNRRFFSDFFFPIFPLQNLFQAHRNPIFLRKIGQFRRFFCPWFYLVFCVKRIVIILWNNLVLICNICKSVVIELLKTMVI